MTATSACLIELEALRERLSGIIRELKHAERMIEVFDAIAPVTPAHTAVARQTSPPPKRTVDPAASHTSTPTPMRGKRAEAAAKILTLLQHAKSPLSPLAIIRGAKLNRSMVFAVLPSLVGTHQVVRAGQKRACTYDLSLRPRAGAGTQAAPPVGPSSANGRQASAGFEVAWNGTKERSGEVPSILPPRERKA